MEKYTIIETERSIVQPEMIDVELAQNGRFAKCFRVSDALKNVNMGAECVMHDDMHGAPVAYCFGDEMHIVNAPKSHCDARRQISQIAGIMRGSLNKFRFYIALRAALKNHGIHPTWTAANNMMRLAQAMSKENTK